MRRFIVLILFTQDNSAQRVILTKA